jgi:Acetoacetate decarboxylase (ADC)
MPAADPSYPAGPYRFIDREYMVITYETDPDVVHAQLPEPLKPIAQPLIHYEWIKSRTVPASAPTRNPAWSSRAAIGARTSISSRRCISTTIRRSPLDA